MQLSRYLSVFLWFQCIFCQGFKVKPKIRELAYLRQRSIQMFRHPSNKLSISGRVKQAAQASGEVCSRVSSFGRLRMYFSR